MKSAEPRILRAYLVCATPRTGSMLLQEAPSFTRVAGNPLEYFGISDKAIAIDPDRAEARQQLAAADEAAAGGEEQRDE